MTLGALVPATWRPEHLDRLSLEYTIERLAERQERAGW
jgi:hypothetical protein